MSRCLDVEVCVGEAVGLDTLEEPPECVAQVTWEVACFSTTAGKHAPDALRMSAITEPESPGPDETSDFVVVDYCPFHGGPVDGRVSEVFADDREDAVRMADGNASGIAALDDQ